MWSMSSWAIEISFKKTGSIGSLFDEVVIQWLTTRLHLVSMVQSKSMLIH